MLDFRGALVSGATNDPAQYGQPRLQPSFPYINAPPISSRQSMRRYPECAALLYNDRSPRRKSSRSLYAVAFTKLRERAFGRETRLRFAPLSCESILKFADFQAACCVDANKFSTEQWRLRHFRSRQLSRSYRAGFDISPWLPKRVRGERRCPLLAVVFAKPRKQGPTRSFRFYPFPRSLIPKNIPRNQSSTDCLRYSLKSTTV